MTKVLIVLRHLVQKSRQAQTFGFEVFLSLFVVRIEVTNQIPEILGMIHVFKMTQFVNDDVID